MCRRLARTFVVLTGIVVIAGCTHHVAVSHAAISHSDLRSVHQPTAEQRALGIYQPYSDADVEFMTGMIPHHAQAVVMAGWAPSHGARSDVTIFCERIVVGQNDEIHSMQSWLEDRGQPVPDAKSTRMHMKMNGVEHDMLMPGMLTDEEMAALDKARGGEFDRYSSGRRVSHSPRRTSTNSSARKASMQRR